jgi:hypothetical protein
MGSGSATNRWFHTIVVVGASLGGCGGQSVRYVDEADDGAGGTGGSSPAGGTSGAATGGSLTSTGGATSARGGTAPSTGGTGVRLPDPSDCPSSADFVCADYTTLSGCHCKMGAPRAPADCSNPFAFRCTLYPPGAPPSSTARAVDCSCVPDFPACPAPRTSCQQTEHGFANCNCAPDGPTSRDECTGGEYWSCQSRDPEFGCHCECCIIR